MKAVVLAGPGDLRIVNKPVPDPGPGEVLVRVAYCGICGSDIHACEAGFFPPGVTIGHEFAGTVAAVGPESGSWVPGQKVTGNNITGCGECRFCRAGRDNICAAMRRLGITAEGAMAEYILIPARSLYPLPGDIPLEWGALAEPLSVGLHGANLAAPAAEQAAVILGAGTIGLAVLAALRERGLRQIAVVEPETDRAAVAARLGAATVIDPRGARAAEEMHRFTGGRGADVVFECAGTPDTAGEAFGIAGRGGTVVLMGICERPVAVDFLRLVTREILVVTALGKTAAEFGEAVELLSRRRVDLSPLLSRVIPLEAALEGFRPPRQGCGREIKILVSAVY